MWMALYHLDMLCSFWWHNHLISTYWAKHLKIIISAQHLLSISSNQTTAVYKIKAAALHYINITKAKHISIFSTDSWLYLRDIISYVSVSMQNVPHLHHDASYKGDISTPLVIRDYCWAAGVYTQCVCVCVRACACMQLAVIRRFWEKTL